MGIIEWDQMLLWPGIWDKDFGFAPIGVHKVEPNMLWFYDDHRLANMKSGPESVRRKLFNAQVGAAIARLIKMDHMAIQVRGKNVWLWKGRSDAPTGKEGVKQLFDSKVSLIGNLADAAVYTIEQEWNRPAIVATTGKTDLHMLLGKFDIAGTYAIL